MSEHDEHSEAIGSVGDEAAKLLGALSEWARDQGTGAGDGLGDLAGQAARSAKQINDHIATGAEECTYCPICRTVHVIRETSPEVKAHLVTAASSLLQAATALLETQVAREPGAGERTAQVERIDLDSPDAPGEQET